MSLTCGRSKETRDRRAAAKLLIQKTIAIPITITSTSTSTSTITSTIATCWSSWEVCLLCHWSGHWVCAFLPLASPFHGSPAPTLPWEAPFASLRGAYQLHRWRWGNDRLAVRECSIFREPCSTFSARSVGDVLEPKRIIGGSGNPSRSLPDRPCLVAVPGQGAQATFFDALLICWRQSGLCWLRSRGIHVASRPWLSAMSYAYLAVLLIALVFEFWPACC